MTREEAIKQLKTLKDDYYDDDGYGNETQQYDSTMLALDMAIEALGQEYCEDAISRERVLCVAIINQYNAKQAGNLTQDEVIRDWDNMIAFIEGLPSAKPKEKNGHWIIVDDCEKFIAKCSVCGRVEDSRMVHKYPYCHCGAKMKGDKE